MFHLLKIEWLKVRYYKAFWILLFLSVAFMLGWNYFLSNGIADGKKAALAKNPMAQILPNPYEMPGTFQMVSYSNSYFLMAMAILLILLLTNEYNFRTSRQNIIDGLSRWQFAVSKLLLMVIFSIIATATTLASVVIVANYISPNVPLTWDNAYYLGYFFLQSIMYFMVALLLSMLVKRSGLAIGLYFFVMIADTLLGLILNKYVHPGGYFLPLDATDNLIPNPMRSFLKDDNRPADNLMVSAAIAYILIFIALFVQHFKRADLK